jgi:hypothetical protein
MPRRKFMTVQVCRILLPSDDELSRNFGSEVCFETGAEHFEGALRAGSDVDGDGQGVHVEDEGNWVRYLSGHCIIYTRVALFLRFGSLLFPKVKA